MPTIRYPSISVKLSGKNGNAFNLLGLVQQALKDNKVPKHEIAKFLEVATSGDYNHLLATCCSWVNVS